MQINIKTSRLDLTPQLEQYLTEKISDVERLVDKDDSSAYCDIQLGKKDQQHMSGNIYTVKVNLHVAGRRFRATAREVSIEAALNEIKDQLMKDLGRYKDKKLSFVRRSGAKIKQLLRFTR